MLITEIRRQKGHLVGLYCGDELIMSIDSDMAAEINIQPMREYSVDYLRELLEQSELRRAKSKALYLLEFRDYSARDLEQKLKKDFAPEICREAVEFMIDIGGIDDARYAATLVRHLVQFKHYGRHRIRQELSLKGVDRDVIDEVLDEAELDEQAMILELLNGKFSKDLSDQKGVNRTIASLTRYGYSYSDIKSALREYIDSLEENSDWD